MCVCSSPPPRFIIIDNGTEFIGENFQRILKDYGIQVHRIHAYTHLKKMEKLNDGGKQLNIVLQVHLSNHI